MSPLRFCFVTTFYPPYNFGGDGYAVQGLARALVDRGHSVTVVHDADAYRTLAGEPPERGSSADGVEVVRLHSRLATLSSLLTHQTGRPVMHGPALRRLLDDGGLDLIHFHNVSLVGGPGLFSMGRAAKLYTAHEHWLVCPTHVLWRDGREACTSRACLGCTLRHRRPPQLWRHSGYLQRQLSHVDAFIAQSEFSRQKHRAFGFPREMEVLPPVVSSPAPIEAGTTDRTPHHRPYFLFVGRLEPMKGLAEIIPVLRAYPDADLLVAGEGTQGEELRRLAGGDGRIRFLGRISPELLGGYLRHAIALLAPNTGYETFGLVLIEAFREGTPVIARRIGPFPELVEASGGGELFDTEAELLAGMRRLQHDPRYRRSLAEAARRGYRERWSEDVVVPRYLELVDRVLAKRGRPTPRMQREAVAV